MMFFMLLTDDCHAYRLAYLILLLSIRRGMWLSHHRYPLSCHRHLDSGQAALGAAIQEQQHESAMT